MRRQHALFVFHAEKEARGTLEHEVRCSFVIVDVRLTGLVESISKKPIPAHVKSLVLEICVNDRDGEDVEVPYIKLNFKQ
jgi:hypothetical protein